MSSYRRHPAAALASDLTALVCAALVAVLLVALDAPTWSWVAAALFTQVTIAHWLFKELTR